MNNRIYVNSFFALVFVIALFGCQKESQEQAGSETISVEADVKALKEENRKYDEALSSGNLDDFVALFTDDAVRMPNNAPIMVGKNEIRSRREESFANNSFKYTSIVEDIKVSGDWAVLRGNYTIVITPKEGGADVTDVGKWIVVYQRQSDGSWKIYSEMWNLNAISS